LIVRGANSAVLPRETADEMLQAQPYARLETIAAIGHAIPEEAPAELAAILQGFAERTAGQVSLPH
jgi:pimeloyl-ACP methyl ester carboxylesterase